MCQAVSIYCSDSRILPGPSEVGTIISLIQTMKCRPRHTILLSGSQWGGWPEILNLPFLFIFKYFIKIYFSMKLPRTIAILFRSLPSA